MANPDPIKLTKKGAAVLLCGERADGLFIPTRLNDDGTLAASSSSAGTSPSVPSRTPLIATMTITSTAQLFTVAGGDALLTSAAGWLVDVPSGGASVRIGKSTVLAGSLGYVATAGYDRAINSSTLAGHYGISTTGADVTITLIGELNS